MIWLKRVISILLILFGCLTYVSAQVFNKVDNYILADGNATENVVVADGFWKNWFVQMNLDMTLQNPYGYDFKDVFPNGKSFGLDFAVGKWFSHQAGVRGKFNWENKLPLLKNDYATWLAPFDEPGVNRDNGGYIAAYGDVLLNAHNLLGGYDSDRAWNLSVYPRVGVNYNFGVSKGSLTVGMGMLNTYRLDERWSLIADVAYTMTGSGFVGANESGGTGIGSNSNGYFTFGLGAQYDINGNSGSRTRRPAKKGVLTNGIWDNWFVQGGIDISLINPYNYDFSKVIPKGQTYGLNAAMGKWLTPEFALRVRLQWDNGLIENKRLEWVPPVEDPSRNFKNGGTGMASIDAMLNLTNVISGYEPERIWQTSFYVRAGIMTQFVMDSYSPVMGAGIEQTYRINDRLGLFGSAGYQVSTSEGIGISFTGMSSATGTNGFFDIDLGVIVDLGQNTFYRDIETKRKAYAQLAGNHNWSRFLVNSALSVGVAFGAKSALKVVIKEDRPDNSGDDSFPSGHTAMMFAGARSIDKEFRSESIWIPVVGYAAATAVGVERVVSDKHHWYDVVAGAALGYGCAELTWWASDKLFGKGSQVAVGSSGNTVDVVYRF